MQKRLKHLLHTVAHHANHWQHYGHLVYLGVVFIEAHYWYGFIAGGVFIIGFIALVGGGDVE